MRFLALLTLLFLPFSVFAIETVTLEWEPNSGWLDSGNDSTYMNLDFSDSDGSLPRRIGVRFLNRGVQIAEVWDKPSDRAVNIGVDLDGKSAVRIQGVATVYAGPWIASSVYSIGDRISVGMYPSDGNWMEVTTAGTTGATEPDWPGKRQFPLSLQETLSAVAAVDNGDGTVTVTTGTHLFRTGDQVSISGTVNYEGTYTLPDQTAAADGDIIITAAYVAETFAGTETVMIAGAQWADNGDGTVSVPLTAHGFTGGETIVIANTTNYDGTYTLAAQADPDVLMITATYVAELLEGGTVVQSTVTDGTVEWTYTEGALATGISEPTGRIVGKLRSGKLGPGGVHTRFGKAIYRTAP